MSRTTWAIVIGVGLLVILVIGLALLSPFGWGRGYGWGWMGPGMMGGFGFGGIMMVLFWVLIIGGVVWFLQAAARGSGQSPWSAGELPRTSGYQESPIDILKVRYAKGEITKEQFEEMKRDLGL